jgi:hypothetical protein
MLASAGSRDLPFASCRDAGSIRVPALLLVHIMVAGEEGIEGTPALLKATTV